MRETISRRRVLGSLLAGSTIAMLPRAAEGFAPTQLRAKASGPTTFFMPEVATGERIFVANNSAHAMTIIAGARNAFFGDFPGKKLHSQGPYITMAPNMSLIFESAVNESPTVGD